ncbi:2-polyprenyl-6-methoxyphenol hydroxylase-like FAD-dependent oxidoreductase [Chitinophaga skermanii]|uniref:Flavin-dependent monooxygenase n=1 Tax=Chitinophaga skermanii TaxID=331697 RepID=A0A327R4B2_9BACT|nr:NAD(P)/FAD-dependent oxidoreductase [Chitinophaga skermanii]RAJ08717.1 2-polyprenyl-6-methoxyphenol hydroxylase-like FAD-dependent oxidoreductase [Chitinophaga skermanii]
MQSLLNKSIAIIGGGPGGLTLARLLQMRGLQVKVYERDEHEHVRVQGATLDLHDDSGLKALEAAGLMDAFKENYRPGADKTHVANNQGDIVFAENEAAEKGFDRPEIDRGPLRKILLASLQPGTVQWNAQVKSMSPEGTGWHLYFYNGSDVYADIVIGADGANSKTRALLTDIKPFYAGVTIVEGSVYNAAEAVPELWKLTGGGKVFVMGNSKSLILSTKGDGSLVFYTGANTPADWSTAFNWDFSNKDSALAWFKEDFAAWGATWWPLFEQAKYPLTVRPQYCMPFDQVWDAQSNLTIVGDAAHLMPPYAGEGVNMAMLDALELADAFTHPSFHSSQEAIAHYETNMRKRASAVAEMTMEQTRALHSEGALEHLVALFSGDRREE